MRVLKFGGTSVKDAEAMQRVENILEQFTGKLIVVLSATSGTTNILLEMLTFASKGILEEAQKLKNESKKRHFEIIEKLGLMSSNSLIEEIEGVFQNLESLLKGVYYLRETTERASDVAISFGETISTKIFTEYLKAKNKKCVWFDAREVIITSKDSQNSPSLVRIKNASQLKISPLFHENDLIITQGFIAKDENEIPTTLGRGGSDLTASLLGNALEAEAIEIWTDVSGVMTVDPRTVETAFAQKELSFKEAAELAYFGARVLHPRTIQPAMDKNIPVWVKNTLLPNDFGTLITNESKNIKTVKAIAFRKNITVITVQSTGMFMAHGFLEKLFQIFSKYEIAIDLISTSEITVSLTIDDTKNLEKAKIELEELAKVRVMENLSIIALVGEEIKNSEGFLKKVFTALDKIPIEMISFGASNVNLSLVLPNVNLNEAVRKLHKELFEKEDL